MLLLQNARVSSSMSWCVDYMCHWYSMWCIFGSWIFEPSRYKISCEFLLFDKRKVLQLYFKYIEILKIYSTLGRRYLAYVNDLLNLLLLLRVGGPIFGSSSSSDSSFALTSSLYLFGYSFLSSLFFISLWVNLYCECNPSNKPTPKNLVVSHVVNREE